MRKTFPLEISGLKPPRVVEGIKNDVRKYVKRERKKKLPEGADFLDFDCRAGKEEASAGSVHLEELTASIDTASQEEWSGIYIEILAKPGYRTRKEKAPAPAEEPAPTDEPSE